MDICLSGNVGRGEATAPVNFSHTSYGPHRDQTDAQSDSPTRHPTPRYDSSSAATTYRWRGATTY